MLSSMTEHIQDYWKNYYTDYCQAIAKVDASAIEAASEEILAAYNRGSRIYIMGNGGSAASASHIICDFNKGVSLGLDKRFNFISLCDSVSTMTALSNDISYEDVFKCQIENNITSDDLLIAISGSGNSKNIIKAVDYAKTRSTKVIGLSGYSGGQLKEKSDISIHFPLNDMQKSEDAHMMILHMIAQYVAKRLGKSLC